MISPVVFLVPRCTPSAHKLVNLAKYPAKGRRFQKTASPNSSPKVLAFFALHLA